MFEAAHIVRVEDGATGGRPVTVATGLIADGGRPGLAMHSAARTLETLVSWADDLVDPAEAANHWLVLSALGEGLPAGALAGLSTNEPGLRLLVDAGATGGEIPGPDDLAAAMEAGVVPLPVVAMRLFDLAGLAADEEPATPPLGCRLAADWIRSGRPVRLVAADPRTGAGGSEGGPGSGTAARALEGAVLPFRPLLGHVPLAVLTRLGTLTGSPGLKALRARHARLNGDVLAALAADPARAALFRAAGLALGRPVRKADGPAPWSEEVFATELGRYGVERAWLGAQIARSRRTFQTLETLRTRETCLIVGNGATLADVDPALFAAHDVIVSNFAFASPLLARHAKILTVTNALVAEQGAAGFNASPIPFKVAPMWLAGVLHEDAGFSFVNATGETAFFGDDPAEKISWSSTVSFFNLQLAFALGYRRALLVGFDHSYVQPQESRLGDVLDQTGDDPNHFDTLYFRKRRWQAADTAAMEEVYRLARAAWEEDRRDVLNLSPGSKLEVFDRHDPAEPLPKLLSKSELNAARRAALAAAVEQDEGTQQARAARAAAGFTCAEAKIGDTLDSDNYSHVVCGLTNVTAKRRSWNYIYFKLQSFNDETYLELRQSDFVPSGFTPWPIPDADTWGAFLRVPLDTPERATASLAHFAGGLGTVDREAFACLMAALPDLVRRAFAAAGDDAAIWARGLATLDAAVVPETAG